APAFDFHASKMEASTSAFFRPPKTQLRSIAVSSVKLDTGELSTDPAQIKHHFREHWGTIFGDPGCRSDGTSTNPNNRQILLDSIPNTLPQEMRETLDSPITAIGLSESIKHMKGNSAPGLDGLTAAFYQIAPEHFGRILCIVYTYQLERGILLPSQRKSCVTLLYKIGDRSDPGNYRPILLISVDVKILSKSLAYRLQDVLPTIAHPDQKGFVKGRSLLHHVHLLDDLLHHTTITHSSSLAIFLDFEKAYDRVVWDYLFLVLAKLGFGIYFISMIRLLYNKLLARLMLNGYLLRPLEATRGVKQGDPLSSLLFLFCIEPLGNLIRSRRTWAFH
ncbi:Pol Polyprotein, partial [Phytophthora megakarya]